MPGGCWAPGTLGPLPVVLRGLLPFDCRPPSSFCWGVHVVNIKMCDPRSSVLLGGCDDELQLLDLSLSASGFWGALLQPLILIIRRSFSNIIADSVFVKSAAGTRNQCDWSAVANLSPFL